MLLDKYAGQNDTCCACVRFRCLISLTGWDRCDFIVIVIKAEPGPPTTWRCEVHPVHPQARSRLCQRGCNAARATAAVQKAYKAWCRRCSTGLINTLGSRV